MGLLRYADVKDAEVRHTFRDVSWRSLAGVVAVMACITGYTAIPKGEPTNPILITIPALATLFFALLLALRAHQCRHPRNWLVKLAEGGIYINLQSQIRSPAHPDAPEVFFIPREAVVGITRVREARTLPTRHGHYRNHYAYFDIAVRDPLPDELLVAVARIRRNPRLRGGTGIRRDFFGAVRIENAHTLRLVWDWMTPREDGAVAIFKDHYPVPARKNLDTPDWNNLTPEEQSRYIDTLWEWGHVEDAIHLSALTRHTSARAAARHLAERLG